MTVHIQLIGTKGKVAQALAELQSSIDYDRLQVRIKVNAPCPKCGSPSKRVGVCTARWGCGFGRT